MKPIKNITLPPGVLKIKKGYNPNSSSIGTLVYAFPIAFIAISSAMAFLASLRKSKIKESQNNDANP